MKTHVYKIQNGDRALTPILTESEKVARYNGLNHKQSLQLRLLCEELVNMLPALLAEFSGEFWIETQGEKYELCVSILAENMDFDTRDRLIQAAKNRQNAAAVGVSGKIRAVFDYMVMGENAAVLSPVGRYGFAANMDYSQVWSLQQYRYGVQQTGEADSGEWDEFERSILVKLADDVTVGVKGKNVSVIIQKKFA